MICSSPRFSASSSISCSLYGNKASLEDRPACCPDAVDDDDDVEVDSVMLRNRIVNGNSVLILLGDDLYVEEERETRKLS